MMRLILNCDGSHFVRSLLVRHAANRSEEFPSDQVDQILHVFGDGSNVAYPDQFARMTQLSQ